MDGNGSCGGKAGFASRQSSGLYKRLSEQATHSKSPKMP